jgi:hypothetical protein
MNPWHTPLYTPQVYLSTLRPGLLLPFIGAPIIEEALKPSGIVRMLLWWPLILRSQLYTALQMAISVSPSVS